MSVPIRFCYKDKSRECNESYEAHHHPVYYGIDLGGGSRAGGAVMTGGCINLGNQSIIAYNLKEIVENLGKKKK